MAVNAGALSVVAGVLFDVAPAVAVGAVVLAGAVLSHVGDTAHDDAPVPAQPVRDHGAGLRGGGAPADPGDRPGGGPRRWVAGSRRAQPAAPGHVSINLMGWVGLPIMGTLVTLWPTMLRTRLAPDAERNARRALPAFICGTLVTSAGVLASAHLLAVAGIAAYLVGIAWTVGPMAVAMRQRPPASFASWSTLAGVVWSVVAGLLRPGARAEPGRGDGDPEHGDVGSRGHRRRRPPGAAGLAELPGAGDGGRRARSDEPANRPRRPGIGLAPGDAELGLAVCVLPTPSAVRVLASIPVLAALVSTGALLVTGTREAPPGRTRRPRRATVPPRPAWASTATASRSGSPSSCSPWPAGWPRPGSPGRCRGHG